MNESYLFRGKRKDNRQWVEGSLVDKSKWHGCYEIVVCNDAKAEESYSAYEVDPSTIGRCAGLSAAKSYRGDSEDARRVFEHDIFWDGDYEAYFTVRWDNLLAAWMADYGNDHTEWLGDTLNANTEIASTIHDNPELLEAQ